MNKKTYLVDTNILLRYFMDDDEKQSSASKRLITKAKDGEIKLQIPYIVVMETVFNLQKRYQIDRLNIGTELLKVLYSDNIELNGPVWILQAIEEFKIKNISFGDACIAAEAKFSNLSIASFDKDFDKFTSIERHEPK